MMENAVTGELCTWTIFDSPDDAPGWFVLRMFRGETPATPALQFKTLEEAREILLRLYPNMVCLPRSPNDHPSVIETWL